MNLIATVAFGIDMNDKVTAEEFSKMGKRILSNQTGPRVILQVLDCKYPVKKNYKIS